MEAMEEKKAENIRHRPQGGDAKGLGVAITPCGLLCFCFAILGPHPQHLEVPRLGVHSEL